MQLVVTEKRAAALECLRLVLVTPRPPADPSVLEESEHAAEERQCLSRPAGAREHVGDAGERERQVIAVADLCRICADSFSICSARSTSPSGRTESFENAWRAHAS